MRRRINNWIDNLRSLSTPLYISANLGAINSPTNQRFSLYRPNYVNAVLKSPFRSTPPSRSISKLDSSATIAVPPSMNKIVSFSKMPEIFLQFSRDTYIYIYSLRFDFPFIVGRKEYLGVPLEDFGGSDFYLDSRLLSGYASPAYRGSIYQFSTSPCLSKGERE